MATTRTLNLVPVVRGVTDDSERDRLRIVVVTMVLNVVAVIGFVFVPGSNWRTGLALNVADNAILIAYTVAKRDKLIRQLMVFGIAVGCVELITDAWLVDKLNILDYAPCGGPMLWRSPLFMPLAWEIVAVQFGYIGLRLFERYRFPGWLLTGLLGAINIPFYEEMALKIHWWRYHDAVMFPGTHTPCSIIVGEFLIAIYLGSAATWTRAGRYGRSIAAGLLAGASIFFGYALPYWIVR